MATLSVLKFHTPGGAEQALGTLEELQKQGLITVQDAAIVSWENGKKKPKTRHLDSMTGAGALGGAFWGLLFGLIFFVPFLGLAIGAGIGALTGSLMHFGIDEDFINQTKAQITEGTSGLFLLTSDAIIDRVAEGMKGQEFEIIATNLSTEDEAKLREAFAAE